MVVRLPVAKLIIDLLAMFIKLVASFVLTHASIDKLPVPKFSMGLSAMLMVWVFMVVRKALSTLPAVKLVPPNSTP